MIKKRDKKADSNKKKNKKKSYVHSRKQVDKKLKLKYPPLEGFDHLFKNPLPLDQLKVDPNHDADVKRALEISYVIFDDSKEILDSKGKLGVRIDSIEKF